MDPTASDILNKSFDEMNEDYIMGLSSIYAKYTFSLISRVANAIKYMRRHGIKENLILGKLKKELQKEGLDTFSIRKIYLKSFGRPVQDDILPDNILEEVSPAPHTLKLKLKHVPEDVTEGTLVLYHSEFWWVNSLEENEIILKEVER